MPWPFGAERSEPDPRYGRNLVGVCEVTAIRELTVSLPQAGRERGRGAYPLVGPDPGSLLKGKAVTTTVPTPGGSGPHRRSPASVMGVTECAR